MKTLYSALILSLTGLTAFAQPTRTTISNGNATSPLTWDCFCIPASGDNIVINHNVTLDVDYAIISGSATINSSGQLIGNIPTRNFAITGGSFTNNGVFTIGNLYHAGGTFTNNSSGTITVLNAFGIDGTATTQNSGNFSVNDSLYITANATLNNNATFYGKYTASAGSINSGGSYTGTDIYSSGAFSNYAGTGVDVTNIFTSGSYSSAAKTDVSNDFWNSETVTVSGHFVIGNDLWNGDTIAGTATLTNNGTISVGGDLANSETMNGSGKYCVNGGTNNSGVVNGTLDVCDLTGTDFDFNIGTIAGTVTHCSVSCAIGIDETNSTNRFELYPNPAENNFTISLFSNENYLLTIINSLGEIVLNQNLSGSISTIDISELISGIYFVQVKGIENTVTLPLIKR